MEVIKIFGMMHGELVVMYPEAFAQKALKFYTQDRIVRSNIRNEK